MNLQTLNVVTRKVSINVPLSIVNKKLDEVSRRALTIIYFT